MQDFERQLTGDQLLASLPKIRRKIAASSACSKQLHELPSAELHFAEPVRCGRWIHHERMRDFTVHGELQRRRLRAAPTIEYFKKDLAEYSPRYAGPALGHEGSIAAASEGRRCRVVFTEYEFRWTQGRVRHEVPHEQRERLSLGTPSSLNGSHGVHDAQADFNGNIWFSNNVASKFISVGRIDTKTGRSATSRCLISKQCRSGARDRQGRAGNSLVQYQHECTDPNALGRLDPATEKVEIFTTPKGMTEVTSRHEYGC